MAIDESPCEIMRDRGFIDRMIDRAEAGERRIVITESGIATAADVQRMRAQQVHAFLVGETFMRAQDPGMALQQIFAGAEV